MNWFMRLPALVTGVFLYLWYYYWFVSYLLIHHFQVVDFIFLDLHLLCTLQWACLRMPSGRGVIKLKWLHCCTCILVVYFFFLLSVIAFPFCLQIFLRKVFGKRPKLLRTSIYRASLEGFRCLFYQQGLRPPQTCIIGHPRNWWTLLKANWIVLFFQ